MREQEYHNALSVFDFGGHGSEYITGKPENAVAGLSFTRRVQIENRPNRAEEF